MKKRIVIVSAVLAAAIALVLAVLSRYPLTSHATQRSALGTARPSAELVKLLDAPGPIELETVNSSDWSVNRSGLINLDHPTAKRAGLEEGDEPIQIFFHVLRHPTRGTFLVDTGVETALRDAPEKSVVDPGGLVATVMHMERLKIQQPLGAWLAKEPKPVAGVFLTHLHLDHILGMPDLPAATPIYTGPGEAGAKGFGNVFVRGITERALAGKPALSEWAFAQEKSGLFEGAVDVFGDGSVWALWVPGHTPGSTAYLVRSTRGPVLLVGDACHTRWGWEHAVEPGSFTADAPRGVESLEQLKAFVSAHPNVEVRLGHQR
jgi:glyoxylase-like metal-dependent hydrolase (beta-lactamase superfamily II)